MAPFPVDVVASNINLTPPEGAKIPYSVIIPARNEETLLPRCLAALAQALHSAETTAEVIVVLNRCSDSTGQIAAQTGCTVIENNAKYRARTFRRGRNLVNGFKW